VLAPKDAAGPFLSPERVAALMAPLGPFEPAPALAVGVSGGPDSLALTLLLGGWAANRNGRVAALTVDHRLRPESTAEAETVGRWLANQPGITHHILPWTGPKPAQGIQAAARAARYRLMSGFCRDQAILHLCVAHHRDDQHETHRLRAGHGSGPIGLAGMSAVRALDGVRLLRPLLGVAKAELIAWLAARGQPWIADPSNDNPGFERGRLRAAAAPENAARDTAALHRLGLERRRLEAEAARRLAQSLVLHDAGWAELALESLGDDAGSCLAFGGLLQCLGGGDYPPAEERCREALLRLQSDAEADFTLGGCHLRRQGHRLKVFRDWGAIRAQQAPTPGLSILWDGRFAVSTAPALSDPALTIARLGERGIQELGRIGHPQAAAGVPEPARKALPALWRQDQLVAVPHLGFGAGLAARFRPARGAASDGFTVA
jgi:tRNA(Ile)-lysidine synthase